MSKVLEYKRRLEDSKVKMERANARRDFAEEKMIKARKKLKDLGCNTIEEARKKLFGVRKETEKLQVEIERKLRRCESGRSN